MTGKIGTFTLLTVMTTTASFAQSPGRWEKERPRRKVIEDYGTNIITISPLTVMDYGAGVGLSYEKIFGADKNIGVVLPFSLMLESNNGAGYQYSPSSSGSNANIYFTPGLKIYPFGHSRVTYAVGPTFMVTYGRSSNVWYTGFPVYGAKISWLRMGAMATNYLNFQVTRSLNLGLEMGLGVRYLDQQTYTEPGLAAPVKTNRGVKPTGRFALTFGFRF